MQEDRALQSRIFIDAEIGKFMLDRDERGATINLRNNDWGETALFRGTWDGHDAVVQTLLQWGSGRQDRYPRTYRPHSGLFSTAIESIAHKLLDRGADPSCTRQRRDAPNPCHQERRPENDLNTSREGCSCGCGEQERW